MSGSQDMQDKPGAMIDKGPSKPKPKVNVVSVEDTDASLTQTWVRHRLGVNRGEDRTYRQFDPLLDQRLVAAPADPSTTAHY